MNLYRIEVKICGTAYIKAKTQKEAMEKARALNTEGLEVSGNLISGLPYDHPDLPDMSLSPAMTLHGPWPGDSPSLVDE